MNTNTGWIPLSGEELMTGLKVQGTNINISATTNTTNAGMSVTNTTNTGTNTGWWVNPSQMVEVPPIEEYKGRTVHYFRLAGTKDEHCTLQVTPEEGRIRFALIRTPTAPGGGARAVTWTVGTQAEGDALIPGSTPVLVDPSIAAEPKKPPKAILRARCPSCGGDVFGEGEVIR